MTKKRMIKMTTLNNNQIKAIEIALTHHINYNGEKKSTADINMFSYSTNRPSVYLRIMDYIAIGESGAPSQKICAVLNKYFAAVGVLNFQEALLRLEKKAINND